jgi:hypothetical protein
LSLLGFEFVVTAALDRQRSVAGDVFPGAGGFAGFDGDGAVVEGDGWADVVGDAVEDVAYFVGGIGFDDEVFFALAEGFEVGSIYEIDAAGEFVLGGDGFVAEVEAEAGIASF